MIWSYYSVPGPSGTPRLNVPVSLNDFGEPIVQGLSRSAADRVTPLWLFGDWDPRKAEPRSACEDGVDNDGDGLTDLAGGDPGCGSLRDFTEIAPNLPCDNGVDDDGDGSIDLADPGCIDAHDPSEMIDSTWNCALGPELVLVFPILHRAKRRRRCGGA